MTEIYNILLLMLTAVLTVFGVMFLTQHIPTDRLCGNYRKARRAMAAGYFIFAAVNFVEYLMNGNSENILFTQTVVLSVAFSQAFLFTLTCLLLLDLKPRRKRWFFTELAVVVLFMTIIFVSYFVFPEKVFGIAIYGFMAAYLGAMVHYTLIFVRYYRRFRSRMDNYYSDGDVANSLQWVLQVFVSALAVGIMALTSVHFMSVAVGVAFEMVYVIFYVFFGIRLLNYVWQFGDIKAAAELETPQPLQPETVKTPAYLPEEATQKQIEQWITDRKYAQQGVTISDLAAYLGTNTKYVSLYINGHTGMTFRNWIGSLRIVESQRLMRENPTCNLETIAEHVGYAGKSAFLTQFARQMQMSPSEWKKKKN